MIDFYVLTIEKGIRTIDEIPYQLRERVRTAYENKKENEENNQ